MTIKESLQVHKWAIKNTAVIPPDMIMSEAFRSLTSISKSVLVRLLQKRPYSKEGRGKNARVVYNNNKIIFTYSEARCFKIGEASFRRAIKELIEKGFIEIEHQGGGFGFKKDYNIYNLIDDYKLWGTPDFKTRTKDPVIKTSRGFTDYNEKRKFAKITVIDDCER
jgi:hypothetical protein